MQTPLGGQADQARWGDGKYPKQTNKQTKPGDGTHPSKKSMQSGERYHQATSDYQWAIPGRYNPSEAFSDISKIDKSYFIKNQSLCK